MNKFYQKRFALKTILVELFLFPSLFLKRQTYQRYLELCPKFNLFNQFKHQVALS